MTIEDTNRHMLDLTAAAHTAITDWSDIRVRGYLKEHPDLVEQNVTRLEDMLATIRQRIAAERADNLWGGPLPEGAATQQYAEGTQEFAKHRCNCGWCLRAEPADIDEPIVWTFPAR
ncbi:hypothetical protein ACFWNQ_24910 [Streptomyces virginiae]|uniref:hypothetical protein n=1 Tax=Streptomyces virginiae TaxID=1961 RepID=UPI0036553D67